MTEKIMKSINKKNLEHQLSLFFNETSNYSDSKSFISGLMKIPNNNSYIFGGMLRDINLFGFKNFCSDIDIVFEGSSKTIENFIENHRHIDCRLNKFGGYRVYLNKAEHIDIWQASNSWAFKNKHVCYDNINSLLDTTFMSWDAALYDIKKSNLITKDDYFDQFKNLKLDLVLSSNQNLMGSLVKLCRTILTKKVCSLEYEASYFLINTLDKYTFKEILSYEEESYKESCLSAKHLGYLKKKVFNNHTS